MKTFDKNIFRVEDHGGYKHFVASEKDMIFPEQFGKGLEFEIIKYDGEYYIDPSFICSITKQDNTLTNIIYDISSSINKGTIPSGVIVDEDSGYCWVSIEQPFNPITDSDMVENYLLKTHTQIKKSFDGFLYHVELARPCCIYASADSKSKSKAMCRAFLKLIGIEEYEQWFADNE